MHCGATKSLFAHVVPGKGADFEGYVVEQIRQDVLWLGHSKVTIRSDSEPALVQVVNQVVAAFKMSGVETVTAEGSVPYDAQTNGAADGAGRLIKGMLKILFLGLERELDEDLLKLLVHVVDEELLERISC